MEGQYNKSLKMLLSLGIEELHDDNFEDSLNDTAIFKDVFFGDENGRNSKKCLVTGLICFENYDNTPKASSFPSVVEEDSGSLSEEFVSSKRRKVSSLLEHSRPQSETIVNSETDSRLIVTCRLVESSVHGVKSRCYLRKGHVADIQDADSPESHDTEILFKKTSKDSSLLQLDDDESVCSFEDQNNKPGSKLKRQQQGKKGKKYKNRKGSCRLLPRGNNGEHHHLKENCFSYTNGVRTVLSWLIDSGIIHLNDVIQYKNPRDKSVIKHGLITRDGVLCRCCDDVFSVSKFKIHCGFTLNCPCLNLFMESGKSLTLCQLEAWSMEYKVKKSTTQTVNGQEFDQNDDSCGLCGDGGDLICCDNCPSTFHRECLCLQELPEGNWYCANCSCWSCGNLVDTQESQLLNVRKCLQCKHKYHKECVRETELGTGLVPSNWFCSKSCKEIHSGLDSRVGMMNSISDGFSWTLLRCTHGDRNVLSDNHFVALKVEWNLKLAVALTIMEECFLPMIDPRTGIDMIPHVLYNQGSEFARLDYEGFYTVILEKDDMLLSIACVRIHGIGIAEMPLIATCSKYQRQGMCRRLMNAIEEMLKSLKIEKLVMCAVPSLVETWIKRFGFMHLEPKEKKHLKETNLMVFPGTVCLKKPLYQRAIHKTVASYRGFGLEEDKTLMAINGKESLQKDGERDYDSKDKQHSRFETTSFEMVCGVK